MKILGIETSCDETAAAVVEDGTTVLSSVVASQVKDHRPFGGVVPELAARKHVEAISWVTQKALDEAGITAQGLSGVAATQGPGLVGALLVGFCFAKAYAYGLDLPLVGVNHLEGHVQSLFLTGDPPPFPFAALLASGGHTSIYLVKGPGDMEPLGSTRDDAAGEAYDKVAKFLGLGYPGGQIMDQLAAQGDPGHIRFPRPMLNKENFEFSFSGLKTAVLRYVQENPDTYERDMTHIAASFQAAVVEVLSHKLIRAAKKKNCSHVAVVGGVAANQGLRRGVSSLAKKNRLGVRLPPLSLCGDNAAMIAAAGHHQMEAGATAGLSADVYSRIFHK